MYIYIYIYIYIYTYTYNTRPRSLILATRAPPEAPGPEADLPEG